uniref:Uncharacterized protein n=1 Tax=Coprothermobacter proteolyticus (strain ATCC 35245 / DSM 5265 / OCM 4 / BT) TaxID=309798 RepID=B5Y815_COPPD
MEMTAANLRKEGASPERGPKKEERKEREKYLSNFPVV